MKFQTRLLHGKAVDTYANGATVPPVSFANAFAYETSEQLEKVFQNLFFVKHFSLKKASEFPVFNEGFSLL